MSPPRLRLVLGEARRDARIPHPKHPDALARGYNRAIQRRVHLAHTLLLRRMTRALAVVGDDIDARAEARDDSDDLVVDVRLLDAVARADSAKTDLAKLLQVITEVERAFGKANPPDTASLATTAAKVDTFTTRQTLTAVKAVLDIDIMALPAVRDLHLAWVEENVGLITSIDERYFDDIRASVIDVVRTGQSTKQLAKDLSERYAVSKSRGELIAQDQIAKLNGQITKSRQTGLGITRFQWSTSLDRRVRDTHRALEGKIFSWSEGAPGEGFPGQPIRCRCVALPVFDSP